MIKSKILNTKISRLNKLRATREEDEVKSSCSSQENDVDDTFEEVIDTWKKKMKRASTTRENLPDAK